MDEIYTLYHNEYGMSFKWKRGAAKDVNRIQLVFKNTGLFLTQKELVEFSKGIEKTMYKPRQCRDCKINKDCKSLLLETPAYQVSFAVSYNELMDLNDLVKGTLFTFQLKEICTKLSIRTL